MSLERVLRWALVAIATTGLAAGVLAHVAGRIASSSVHYLLYALIILVPILGWANASYRGWRVTIFGIIPLPGLVPARDAVPSSAIPWGWTGDVHIWMSYGLLGVAVLHILAGLYHRFVLRDRVLDRMLPRI